MSITDFDSTFWSDTWIEERTAKEKLLHIYLWTNPHKNVACLYSISIHKMVIETGLTEKEVREALQRLYPKVRYDYDNGIVWVRNHVKRQFMKTGVISPKIIIAIEKCLHAMPTGHKYIGAFLEYYPMLNLEYSYAISEAPIDEEGKATGKKKAAKKGHEADEQFMEFYEAYPRGDDGPKAAYEKWPKKMTAELFKTIMDKLEEYKSCEQWKDPTKVPMARTWLNQERWKASVVKEGPGSKIKAPAGKYDGLAEKAEA